MKNYLLFWTDIFFSNNINSGFPENVNHFFVGISKNDINLYEFNGFYTSITLFKDLVIIDFFGISLKFFLVFCSIIFYFGFFLSFLSKYHNYGEYFLYNDNSNINGNENISIKSQDNLFFIRNFLFLSTITLFFLLNLIISYDLLYLFLSLEGLSLCLYVLAGLRIDNKLSMEAGLKYFLISAIFSCIFGFSSFLLFFITGSTNFYFIRESIGLLILNSTVIENISLWVLLILAVFLMLIVFFMKLGAAPYHFLNWRCLSRFCFYCYNFFFNACKNKFICNIFEDSLFYFLFYDILLLFCKFFIFFCIF